MVEAYRIGVTITTDAVPFSRAIDRMIADLERVTKAQKGLQSSLDRMFAELGRKPSDLGFGRKMAEEFDQVRASADRARESVANMHRATEAASTGNGGLHDLGFWTGIGAAGVARMVGGADSRGFTTDTLLSILGSDSRISPAQLRQTYNAAYRATQSAPGTHLNTNLEALIDLTNVLGNVNESMAALPAFARMTSRLQAIDRRKGGSGDEAYAAAKAMDIMGGMIDRDEHINPTLLQARLDRMTRVAVATNDRVDPIQYLGFAKQARSAGMQLSDEFVYERLPAIIQSVGGQRAGTALMSMSQVYQGNRLTDKSYDALVSLGLAAPDRPIITRDALGHKHIKHRYQVYDLDAMSSDPLNYVMRAEARMDAHGIHGADAQMRALSNVQQRSTIAGILADLIKDMPAILRDQERIRHTNISRMDNNAASSVNKLTSAWDNFLTVAGNSNTKDAISVLDHMSAGLNALTRAEKANPNLARYLTDAAAGLAVLGVAAGGAALAVAPLLALKRLMEGGKGAIKEGEEAAGKSAGLFRRVLGTGIRLGGRFLGPAGLAYEAFDPYSANADEAEKIRTLREEGRISTHTTLNVTVPLHLDGKEIGRASAKHSLNQLINDARSSSGTFDDWGSPRLPSVAGAH